MRLLWAAGQPEHSHLMEFEQLVADETVNEVGGHQPPSPVQRLAVEEAVLVHVAPHQQVVACVDVQLGLGVVVGRLRERVVRVPAKCTPGVRTDFICNRSFLLGHEYVTATLAGNVKHVEKFVVGEHLVRQHAGAEQTPVHQPRPWSIGNPNVSIWIYHISFD